MSPFLATNTRIGIRRPTAADRDEFISLVQASRQLHDPWGDWPNTPERFDTYLQSRQLPSEDGFLICNRDTAAILGLINVNNIVRGMFQSAFLGYFIGAPFAHQGYMTEAMRLVCTYAFIELNLHRLEANIQPTNAASRALVRKCGFQKEGYSSRYLQVNGQWRDHERWAILAS